MIIFCLYKLMLLWFLVWSARLKFLRSLFLASCIWKILEAVSDCLLLINSWWSNLSSVFLFAAFYWGNGMLIFRCHFLTNILTIFQISRRNSVHLTENFNYTSWSLLMFLLRDHHSMQEEWKIYPLYSRICTTFWILCVLIRWNTIWFSVHSSGPSLWSMLEDSFDYMWDFLFNCFLLFCRLEQQ